MALKSALLSLLGASLLSAAVAEPVARSNFTEVTSFGDNPSGSKMYLYVPATLAANPPVVVGIHWCHGSASAYYQGTQWATLSETYGFIVIYPESPYISVDACWDVSSSAALTHNGGGDSNAIANMVTFVLDQYKANASKVFVTGISSGAMMTNVMAATYPELFAAGVVYAGVPAGCFMSADDTADYWNSTCATGGSVAAQSYWVDAAKKMYPGYAGSRPKMQIYHGDSDETLNYNNYGEEIKQWAGLLGYSTTPAQTLANNPTSPFTKYIFGDKLQGIVGAGVTHNINHNETEDLIWFGLDSKPATSSTSSSRVPTSMATLTTVASSTTTKSSTTATATGTAAHWAQCGGIGYTGPTACVSPYTCKYQNDWYSQCL